jgi:hypothetical protein
MEELDKALRGNLSQTELLWRDQNKSLFLDTVVGLLSSQVYKTGRIPQTTENDIRLDAIFSSQLCFVPKYYDEHKAEAFAVTTSMIRFFFPPESR